MTKPTDAPALAPALTLADLTGTAPDVGSIVARFDEMAATYDRLMLDLEATGIVDRVRLRECLASFGEARRELLIALGQNPQSEDWLPFPAQLHDA